MKRVAFFKVRIEYDGDYDYSVTREIVLGSNIKFEEVTDEEYKLLQEFRYNVYNEKIVFIEQDDNMKDEAMNSIKDMLAAVEEQKRKNLEAKAKREQKAAERKAKKLAKDRSAREKLYKELQQEFKEK